MREIKFRAWNNDGITPIMEYFDLFSIKKQKSDYQLIDKDGYLQTFHDYRYDVGKICLKTEHNGDNPDIIIMQFTGLHDKNGKEIYEGDIINDGDNNLMVKFSNYFLGYFVWVGYGGFIEKPLYDIPLIEVVGNIHQNPELLEGK